MAVCFAAAATCLAVGPRQAMRASLEEWRTLRLSSSARSCSPTPQRSRPFRLVGRGDPIRGYAFLQRAHLQGLQTARRTRRLKPESRVVSLREMTQATASIDGVEARGGGVPPSGGPPSPRLRVLVVYEEGRAGRAAILEAAELAASGAELTVVTLAPQAKPLKCCEGGGAGPYNCAVRDAAAEELRQARALLGSLAKRASFTTLVGTPEPPLAEWSAGQSLDAIILPGHRLERRGGRLARDLRRATRADVRVVRQPRLAPHHARGPGAT